MDSKYNISLQLINELFIYSLLKIILPYFNIKFLYCDISILIYFPSEFTNPSLFDPFSDDSKYVFEIESFNFELSCFKE